MSEAAGKPLKTVTYSYYSLGDRNGTEGDLKYATVYDAQGNEISHNTIVIGSLAMERVS